MAGASLLALLDDIATVLDDVAVMTKVAAKKTAGVLGDDLALNAQQVAGVQADRELPVVWAVAVGSLKNKVILVPAALAISWVAPWLITPLLMIGGLYLCYEGTEKLAERWLHRPTAEEAAVSEAEHQRQIEALLDDTVDMAVFEAEKIKGAIRTDFVLSAEIIVIALGVVASETFTRQLAVLCGISLLMTVGVYGFVAAIVKIDDLGLYLLRTGKAVLAGPGRVLVSTAPKLMKVLTVVGTAAMFLVGGSILAHGLHLPPDLITGFVAHPWLQAIAPTLLEAGVGLLAGCLALMAVTLVQRLRGRAT